VLLTNRLNKNRPGGIRDQGCIIQEEIEI
jgi:hypothetical protein